MSFFKSLVLTSLCATFDFHYLCLRGRSELIADRHPTIVQVVSPSKYLKVIAIRHKILSYFIDFFRLLRLSSPLTKDDVTVNSVAYMVLEVSLVPDQAGLLRML